MHVKFVRVRKIFLTSFCGICSLFFLWLELLFRKHVTYVLGCSFIKTCLLTFVNKPYCSSQWNLWNEIKMVFLGSWKFLLGKFPPRKSRSIKLPPGNFPRKSPTWSIPTHFICCVSLLNTASKYGEKVYMYILIPGRKKWYLQDCLDFSHETLAIIIKSS